MVNFDSYVDLPFCRLRSNVGSIPSKSRGNVITGVVTIGLGQGGVSSALFPYRLPGRDNQTDAIISMTSSQDDHMETLLHTNRDQNCKTEQIKHRTEQKIKRETSRTN